MDDRYWLIIESEQKGPYKFAQLQSMWRSGSVTDDTLYWQEGFDEWIPLSVTSDLLDPKAIPTVPTAQFQVPRTPTVTKPSTGCLIGAFRLVAIAVGVLIVLALALIFLTGTTKPDAKDVTPEGATKGAIFLTTCHMVEKRLKSPTTAKFPSYYETGTAEVISLGDRKYSVRSYVDSQNSFGAMVRTHWTAIVTVQLDGDHVRLEDLQTQ